MNFKLPVASNFAPTVDHILICLLVISAGIMLLVFGLMWVFMIKYRAGSPIDRGAIREKTWRIEVAWTTATFFVFLGLFYWGADVYLDEYQPPPDTMKISVVGKRWMWKFEYPGGQREINELHVPVGRKVQLVMTSEDVIHDLAIPAFRVRHDVLPGRYETIWFIADVPGTYDLYCTRLCGAEHSEMRGNVVVMKPADYQRWLEQNGSSSSLVAAGQELFVRFGCSGCHMGGGTVRAPSLDGVFGSPVPLSDGTTIIADDKYLRDSILYPTKQVVASYVPVMPSFDGKVSNADLEKLIAYIKSLGAESQ
ncbi:MAG TPA: cytochrome c oxidase subunit II [Acetobacteraceae bacterium]|nr:cytochrome c oxidase subunit II [Acetobacteraceae bacterium]